MMMNYEILSWDTDHFGLKIAEISENVQDEENLEATILQLKHDGVVMASYKPGNAMLGVAIQCGGFLADLKKTFQIDIDYNEAEIVMASVGCEISAYQTMELIPELESLAFQSGEYSRFRVDKSFSQEAFEKLYRTWILRSIRKEIADQVFVAKFSGRVVGMITLAIKNDIGIIGLFAVDKNGRGQGIGKALIAKSIEFFKSRGIKMAKVVTQGANSGACKFYKSCGFYEVASQPLIHFWFEEIEKKKMDSAA